VNASAFNISNPVFSSIFTGDSSYLSGIGHIGLPQRIAKHSLNALRVYDRRTRLCVPAHPFMFGTPQGSEQEKPGALRRKRRKWENTVCHGGKLQGT
jgi:hypothetical protein